MIWRIVDASLNRACEGLRVAEEILRFGGASRPYLALKNLRHRLRTLFAPVEQHLLAARDTTTDPGRTSGTEDEYHRKNISYVFCANMKRAEEALRILEETSKTHDPHLAAEVEKIRFEVYRVEKEWSKRIGPYASLQEARLYVVCSRSPKEAPRVAEQVAGIADLFQLRLKGVSDREYLEAAEECRKALEGTSTLFVVNDRPDIAAIVGADGLHLGADDTPPKKARKVFCGIIGATVHSPMELKEALQEEADYLGVGAFYPTKTKANTRVQGLPLAEMMEGVDVVWFAIGGVTEERLEELVEAGVERVAVGEAVCGAEDAGNAARRIRKRLLTLLQRRDFEGTILEP